MQWLCSAGARCVRQPHGMEDSPCNHNNKAMTLGPSVRCILIPVLHCAAPCKGCATLCWVARLLLLKLSCATVRRQEYVKIKVSWRLAISRQYSGRFAAMLCTVVNNMHDPLPDPEAALRIFVVVFL